MGKRRKFESNLLPVDRYLAKLKYKDLKRECVIRGMVFEKVVDGTFPKLSNWLRNHFDDEVDHSLLDGFDDWQEQQIRDAVKAKGQTPDAIIHSSLRLGYIAERDEAGNVIRKKRVRTVIRKKRKKRDKTDDGIYSGTKKALTFKLQQEGLSKADVTKQVFETFPDASPKSVSVWYNKSRKSSKNEK